MANKGENQVPPATSERRRLSGADDVARVGLVIAVATVLASTVFSTLALHQQARAEESRYKVDLVTACQEATLGLEQAANSMTFDATQLDNANRAGGQTYEARLQQLLDAITVATSAGNAVLARCESAAVVTDGAISVTAPAFAQFDYRATTNGEEALDYARRVASWASDQYEALDKARLDAL